MLQEFETSFRQGVNGYTGTLDTQLSQQNANTQYSTAAQIGVDKTSDMQTLLRFDNLFGAGGIPDGAQILSATLTLQTTNSGNGATIHRMLQSWSPTATWNSFINGVSADGVEAVATPDMTTGATSTGATSFDVTASVQAWANGAVNNGWVFRSLGTNGWDFYSSEGSVRPQLTIRYATETTTPATIGGTVSGAVTEDGSSTLLTTSGTATVSDPDAGEAFFRPASGSTSYGSFTVASDGGWTYSASNNQSAIQSLAAGETLSDSFVITSLDGTASGTVGVVITGVNDAPVAANDSDQVNTNSSIVINILGNDIDIDGDTLTVSSIGAAAHGAAVLNPNKTINYTPASGYLGSDSFTYTISDGQGGTSSAAVNITVKPATVLQEFETNFRQGVNGYTGTLDTQLSQQNANTQYSTAAQIGVDKTSDMQTLLRFDNLFGAGGIPDGAQILSATLTLQTTNSGNGATIHRMLQSWSPTATWNSFINGVSADGVEAVATPDMTTGATSTGATSFDVTASVQAWANGAVNNGWVFRSLGTNGWDFYSSEGSVRPQLTIRYATETTTPATIGGTVSGAVTEDGSSTLLTTSGTATVSDPDAGEAFFRPASGSTSYGSFTVASDGGWTYSASNNQSAIQSLAAGETLSDSFVITSLDGTASGTVGVVITGVNDAPVAANDSDQVNTNSSIVINILGNDIDIDGDTLTVSSIGAAAHGAAVLNPNKTINYTPASGYLGSDSFTYTISDGQGGTSSAAVNITVKPATVLQEFETNFRQGVNGYTGTLDTQLSQQNANTQYSTAAQIGVDKTSDMQTLLRFDNLFGAGGIPDGAQILSATLTLQTTNSGNGATIHRMLQSWSPTATWNSFINGVSADGVEAVATPDMTTGATSTGATSFDVTASVQAWANGAVNNGWVFRSLGTNGWDFYSSEGSVRPQLTIRYATETTTPATIGGTVSGAVTEDGSSTLLTTSGTATVSDPDAGEAFFRPASGSTSYGSFTVASDGGWTYSASNNQSAIQSLAAGETLSDSFVITSLDGTASGTVGVVITGVNDAPVAANTLFTATPNQIVLARLPLASDADGDGITYALEIPASHGTLEVNPDGTYAYTSNLNYQGSDGFSYSVTDENGASNTYSVQISVTAQTGFWVFADTPNSDYADEAVPAFLRSVPESVQFIVHLGDIKPGSDTSSSAGAFASMAESFMQSPVPVFVLPGDNDYKDTSNPQAAWNNWNSVFPFFDQNWTHSFEVNYQPGHAENFAFVFNDVLYVGANLVTGGTSLEPTQASFDWIVQNLTQNADATNSAVLFSHAFPTDYSSSLNSSFVTAARAFEDPILYLQGHKHEWQLDDPYSDAPNVTRVRVEQTGFQTGPDYDPLLVNVSNDAENRFSFDHDFFA